MGLMNNTIEDNYISDDNRTVQQGGWFSKPDPNLNAFAYWYWNIHGYLSIFVCIFGIVTNFINIQILTRKPMRTSVNVVLTAVAISDIALMASYIPYAIHFYIACGLDPTPDRYSYEWTTFMAVHANVTLTTHAISIWLAVFMAIQRYVYLQTKIFMTARNTVIACLVICFASGLVMLPNYLITGVYEVKTSATNGSTGMYRLNEFALGSKRPSSVVLLAFWLYAIVGKLLPCVLISVFMGFLLKRLHESTERRRRLFSTNASSSSSSKKKRAGHKSTTTMLLVIIILYIVTELPQSVLVILSVIFDGFFENVYYLLADILDMAALINNAINFVLYCIMSQQFRGHLMEMWVFKKCKHSRCFLPTNVKNVQSNIDDMATTMVTEKTVIRAETIKLLKT
ncbi:hypothetical protein LOTGIDRAFT_153743 [Lottia gigantea]|uniref:G-protein coupled receptors family 1 profile domain-containing protein n=1 Tax=Lottia gigantea TaxID=225164 RepID=V3ZJ21_LOTGI|nr:hypothetical protein LOTGIDRAFT_153743 [Lottia gigantea]ESO91308.1 hypothetical protein LOTGIDRAFT_153743 [Lottia gigantea]